MLRGSASSLPEVMHCRSPNGLAPSARTNLCLRCRPAVAVERRKLRAPAPPPSVALWRPFALRMDLSSAQPWQSLKYVPESQVSRLLYSNCRRLPLSHTGHQRPGPEHRRCAVCASHLAAPRTCLPYPTFSLPDRWRSQARDPGFQIRN
ncbi:unnamed protein product [Mycena citricolor]|uniref:Uncharacterized protein n=1 Tax=Mycena citricolor TaxID=2018698 RepID=A0AAD2HLM2_9AGAR|nr:unnamed protein product [Mycena citricolor]